MSNASMIATIAVRPLEWIEADHSVARMWRANCVLGSFRVKENGSWSGPRGAIGPWIMAGGVDEAKASAETYYRAMVLSCLSHTAGEIEAGGEVAGEPVQEMHELDQRTILREGAIAVEAADKRIAELTVALTEARSDLLGSGFVGPSPDGVGDPEINRIDAALKDKP